MNNIHHALNELRVALISHRRVFLENAVARVYRRDTELPPMLVGVEHPCAGRDEYWVPFTDTLDEWNQRITAAKEDAAGYREAGKTVPDDVLRRASLPPWTPESFSDELLRTYGYDGMQWDVSAACFEDFHDEDRERTTIRTHWLILGSEQAAGIEGKAIEGRSALQCAIDVLEGTSQTDLLSEVEEVVRAALRDGQPRWFPREVRWAYLKDLDDAVGRVADWVVRVIAGSESHHRPDDLITMAVALKRFSVSRSTIQRAVKQGKLQSYRDEGASRNSTHLLSPAELAKLYPKR